MIIRNLFWINLNYLEQILYFLQKLFYGQICHLIKNFLGIKIIIHTYI